MLKEHIERLEREFPDHNFLETTSKAGKLSLLIDNKPMPITYKRWKNTINSQLKESVEEQFLQLLIQEITVYLKKVKK